MNTKRWIPLLLVVAFPLAACEPEAPDDVPETEELAEPPEFAPDPPPPAEVGPPPDDEVAAREIEVTNPMPHPMIVTATVVGETVELGTVPASSTQVFTVQARGGATVALEARDESDTHRVEGSVTVGDVAARWTIQR